MPATIKIPGIGPVKAPIVYAGVGITVGILVFAYWRRAQAGGSAAVDTVTEAASAGGYAQESDALGYNTVYPSVYSGGQFSPYGYDIYGNPLPAPTGATGTGGTFVSNADWTGAAVDQLEKQGITEQVASTAIARVLGGLPVTVEQQSMFLSALGVLGPPPQGYPAIRLVDSPAQPKPPGTTPKLTAPGGLRAVTVGRTAVRLDWRDVSGAQGYNLHRSGSIVGSTATSTGQIHGLKPNTTYSLGVSARSASGGRGPASVIKVKTKR